MLRQLFSSTCVDLALCRLTKSRSLKTCTTNNRMSLLSSPPHEKYLQPQHSSSLILIKKKYSVLIPSWKYASTHDTLHSSKSRKVASFFHIHPLTGYTEGLYLQKNQNEYTVLKICFNPRHHSHPLLKICLKLYFWDAQDYLWMILTCALMHRNLHHNVQSWMFVIHEQTITLIRGIM